MSTKYWIKLYHEILDDPKIGRLSVNLRWRFVECCLLAGELNADGKLPPISDIAWRLRTEVQIIEAEFDQLARVGLLEYHADQMFSDYWTVTNFSARQDPMEKGEYMKRLRSEKIRERYYSVTNSNADIDTDKDTDIDKDSENDYQKLLTAFINHSQIPAFGVPKPRDNDALLKMAAAGCAPEDVKAAVEYAVANGLTIVGPASIANGALIAAGKRKRGANVKKESWSEVHR